MKLQVIYEDNHLLVVNKPAGILVQGDRTGDPTLLEYAKDYIKVRYDKPGKVFLGLVHRLDRPVSGVVVLARTSKALTRMNELFKKRAVKKTYWALVEGTLAQEHAELVHWMRKDQKKNRASICTSANKEGKKAVLEYQLLMVQGKRRLLEVVPQTGRPHQIRLQLSAIGCPIVGDIKYGYSRKLRDGSVALHAKALDFIHPVKKEALHLEAPIPTVDTWRLFANEG